MPRIVAIGLAYALSYLAGSIPNGWIAVKLRTGKDLRNIGSGNIGATNVSRALGDTWFNRILILDGLKGLIPTLLTAYFFHDPVVGAVAGAISVIGHCFPAYFRFRKCGKGVSTTLGVMLALQWQVAAPAYLIWKMIVRLTGYVSVGSLVGALSVITLQFWTWRIADHRISLIFVGLSVLVILAHIPNIVRLINGKEPKHRPRGEVMEEPTCTK